MGLPCLGSRACNAPRPAAISAAESRSQKLNLLCVEMRSVKRLRGVFCARGADWDDISVIEPEEAGLRSARVTAGNDGCGLRDVIDPAGLLAEAFAAGDG